MKISTITVSCHLVPTYLQKKKKLHLIDTTAYQWETQIKLLVYKSDSESITSD